MIQVQEGGWTFTLDNRKVLTINGEGITKVHRHDSMTADQLYGFALGWVAHRNMMVADSPVQEDKYPTYLLN